MRGRVYGGTCMQSCLWGRGLVWVENGPSQGLTGCQYYLANLQVGWAEGWGLDVHDEGGAVRERKQGKARVSKSW